MATANGISSNIGSIYSNSGNTFIGDPWNQPLQQDWVTLPSPWHKDWNTLPANTTTITNGIKTLTRDDLRKAVEQAKINSKRAALELELAQLALDEFEFKNPDVSKV